MPNKPLPPLYPETKEPIGADALAPLFPMDLNKCKEAGSTKTILFT